MSTFLLLLFEPLSIAFDTLQAVVVHGMQLMDTWQRQTLDLSVHTSGLEPSKRSAAGVCDMYPFDPQTWSQWQRPSPQSRTRR
jgi:hypothetical protein